MEEIGRAVLGKHTIADLHAAATFLRSGSVWIKTLSMIPQVLKTSIIPLAGNLPMISAAFMQELRQYMEYHLQAFKSAVTGSGKESRQGIVYKQCWDKLALWLNGPLNRDSGKFRVYVGSGVHNVALAALNLADSIVDVVYRHMPTKPEQGK